ncbi:N-formylglutamate deformylase [Microbulbifer donghaiensis]|uniref:N-formylglutamate deformylase n=1 Tax=Microbulbifer donghaiensis TaxID=494016 RepID=A0A1M5IAW0_9GAMM|nr:hypothetical protein [Microbulbifer donghaiensis]SHG25528.1 N-formylglutamate deformylase [Microbulbifer donghaiensis]
MEIDDAIFLAQFRDQTLAAGHFDHRGHLRIAWLYLGRYPLREACDRVCAGIRSLAIALGARDKFHHTVSEALVRIMAGRMKSGDGSDFASFLAANADLLSDARGLLAHHYSDECLNSAEARSRWVEPDLVPLD